MSDPSRPWLLGVEIGGTKLQVALGRGDGRLAHVQRSVVDLAAGAAGIRDRIARDADLLAALAEIPRESIESVGFGFGGPVDATNGIILKSHHVQGWDAFDLAGWARSTLKTPLVSVQNDADTAALGEYRHGAGQGKDPLLYVTIGSGIGAGLILNGCILRGSGLGAMELGHVWVDPPIGKSAGETVEQAASGWSIGRRARAAIEKDPKAGSTLRDLVDGDLSSVNGEAVALAAGLGDDLSRSVLSHATESLARGLAHAVTLIGPSRILLGGGVSLIGEEMWFSPIRKRLDELVFPPFRGTYDLLPARLGQDVVLHGALALALDASRTAR